MKVKKSKPHTSTSLLHLGLQKSLASTTLGKSFLKFRQHKAGKLTLSILFYLGLWALFSYIFYLRFPNNYRQPNFFGEEGNVFGENVIQNGFYHAIGTTFNGYYIWVLYLLEAASFAVNSLFFHAEFVNLARSFAVVSYGFLGFVATLPWLLFKNRFKLSALILMSMFIVFVPLGGWDYGILGALGDMKFAVIFVAFLLLLYRHYLPENSKKVYLVDIGILICAYSNITVYAMMPFALLRYWPKLRGGGFFKKLKTTFFTDRSAISLIILGLALLPQLYIIKKYGVPKLPGYLDSPFQYNRTIEIFISRSYLYEVLFPINKFLNDAVVVIGFLIAAGLGWKFIKDKALLIFSFVTIFLSTFLFVVKRTGVSEFYIGYKDPGPSQFFFPQNWIFGFFVSLLIVAIVSKLKNVRYQIIIYALIIAGFMIFARPYTGSFGKNNFEETGVGNIYANAQKECAKPGDKLTLTIYPTVDQKYKDIPRDRLCTASVLNYQPEEVDLGLAPYGNNYLPLGNTAVFTQTFKADGSNLNGLDVFFSTFMKKVKTPYSLNLLDSTCSHQIYSVKIKTSKLQDNSFGLIKFPTVKNSAHQTYCFTITAQKTPADPLAVQLSAPDIYKDGLTKVNGKTSEQDIVFKLHYR